jgi:hypothetical protein
MKEKSKTKRGSRAIALIDRLRVFQVRSNAVVLDSDLAAIYGVETKVFNQAIRRNAGRFPADFLFRLTVEEWAALRSQIVTFGGLNGSRAVEMSANRASGYG